MRKNLFFFLGLWAGCPVVLMSVDGSCPDRLEELAFLEQLQRPETIALRPADRILESELSRTVARVSKSAGALANRFGAKPADSANDRFLDLMSELRERNPLLQKYVAWLYEVERRYKTLEVRTDQKLGELADAIRPDYFAVLLSKSETRELRTRSEGTLTTEEFQKRFWALAGVSERIRESFNALVAKRVRGEPVSAADVLSVMRDRRKTFMNVLSLAFETSLTFAGVEKVQKLLKDQLQFQFPNGFVFVPTDSRSVSEGLRNERAIEPQVNVSMKRVLELKGAPASPTYWDEVISTLEAE